MRTTVTPRRLPSGIFSGDGAAVWWAGGEGKGEVRERESRDGLDCNRKLSCHT